MLGVMEKAWSLGEESSWSYFAKLGKLWPVTVMIDCNICAVEKKKNLPEIVEQVNEKVLEDLGRQIEYLSNMKNIRKSFEGRKLILKTLPSQVLMITCLSMASLRTTKTTTAKNARKARSLGEQTERVSQHNRRGGQDGEDD